MTYREKSVGLRQHEYGHSLVYSKMIFDDTGFLKRGTIRQLLEYTTSSWTFRHIGSFSHTAGILVEFFSQKEPEYMQSTFEAAYGRPCDETDRHTVVIDNFRVAHFAWKSTEKDFERELDHLHSMVCKDSGEFWYMPMRFKKKKCRKPAKT